jgi:quercetin dioxygenase-like cupin family protein
MLKMNATKDTDSQGLVLLPSSDLNEDISFFSDLGFQLDNIFPSDDPAVAVMHGHGLHIRLDKNIHDSPPTLHILTDHPGSIFQSINELVAPNGSIIKIQPKTYHLVTPETKHHFEVRQLKDSDPWVIGRAGMLYRDLIPDRLGGSIIASHINIPNGGPVPDMVHYHTIGFQLIFCYKGWVKLVYEDQGPPFVLKAGDCVTQPPEIRHRVLEASDNLEVIEIGVPADHMTTIDHEMELPTNHYQPDREFHGQTFCRHIAKSAIWSEWRIQGFEYRDSGISKATKSMAAVHVARFLKKQNKQVVSHDADILFSFVMKGKLSLHAEDHSPQSLKSGDAFVIPPHLKYHLQDCSKNLELLEVSLPGDFKTTLH